MRRKRCERGAGKHRRATTDVHLEGSLGKMRVFSRLRLYAPGACRNQALDFAETLQVEQRRLSL
jgi:hypothetical protein